MIDWDSLVLGPCMGVFGEPVDYAPAAGTPTFRVSGVFDEAYRSIAPMGDGPFPSSELSALGAPGAITAEMPVLGVQLSAFPVPPVQGDLLTIVRTSESYVVKEVQPDGHGWAKLLLNGAP